MTDTHDALEESIGSKVVCIREGAALYTAEEQLQNLIDEACALLNVNPQNLSNHDPAESEDEDEDEDEALDALSESALAYEAQLHAAGYTVVWNDGFAIYKDLTDEESEYIAYTQ